MALLKEVSLERQNQNFALEVSIKEIFLTLSGITHALEKMPQLDLTEVGLVSLKSVIKL
jgi:hypothetical protein